MLEAVPDNDLLFSRLLDGLGKLLAVHGVDLTRASDQRCIREHVPDLLDTRAVRASVERSGDDGRGFVVVGDAGQGGYAVVEFIGVKVSDQLDKTGLFKSQP